MKDTTRKMLCTAILLPMALTVSTAASSANISSPDTEGTTVITLTANPQYLVTIPTTVTAEYGSSHTDFVIELESANLAPNSAVSVAIKQNSDIVPLTNNSNSNAKILYMVQERTADNIYTDFDSCDFRQQGDKATLSVAITSDQWHKAPSGKYTGGITFTVQYND